MPKNLKGILCRIRFMKENEIAEFTVKVYGTRDRKKLKGGSKTYEYGTISIRAPELTEHIGETLHVKVFSSDKMIKDKK